MVTNCLIKSLQDFAVHIERAPFLVHNLCDGLLIQPVLDVDDKSCVLSISKWLKSPIKALKRLVSWHVSRHTLPVHQMIAECKNEQQSRLGFRKWAVKCVWLGAPNN